MVCDGPRQVWWMVDGAVDGVGPGGIAHMDQNVLFLLLCCAMLCSVVFVLEQFQVAVAVAVSLETVTRGEV